MDKGTSEPTLEVGDDDPDVRQICQDLAKQMTMADTQEELV